MQALGRVLKRNLRQVIIGCIGCNILLWIILYLGTRGIHEPYQWAIDISTPRCGTFPAIPELEATYEPSDGVAWAIPVGGRTKRSANLRRMLEVITDGGAHPSNIFVFEDDLSRVDRRGDPDVAKVADEFGVRVIPSHIGHDDQEGSHNFGIHLARHYRFMLDTLFHGSTADADESQRVERTFNYAVFLEDDLKLAPDIVKYFHEMSRVMQVDDTLYCIAAHQDNAFPAACSAPPTDIPQLDELHFDFRRGEHFMAPGWMTSRAMYLKEVRPNFLDAAGEYHAKERIGLKNGHWDRFFDSQIRSKECIFPEVPRITHDGADGFTVSGFGQKELYDNLELSKLLPSVDYGDLTRFTAAGYEKTIYDHIEKATVITDVLDTIHYRRQALVMVVEAYGDLDSGWSNVVAGHFGLIALGGYGGNPKYAKLRGVHKGAMFVRWMTNLVLLVGRYSPYFKCIHPEGGVPYTFDDLTESAALNYEGCFEDSHERDLPVLATQVSGEGVNPARCSRYCRNQGYKYAAVQMGEECWCGSTYGRHKKVKEGECNHVCNLASGKTFPCGGAFRNSIYSSNTPLTVAARTSSAYKSIAPSKPGEPAEPGILYWPPDALLVAGREGESCTMACERATPEWQRIRETDGVVESQFAPDTLRQVKATSTSVAATSERLRRKAAGGRQASSQYSSLACNAELMPLLHTNCDALKELMGCSSCIPAQGADQGWISPGMDVDSGRCYTSKGQYLTCKGAPDDAHKQIRRACVCELIS